ncbi:hypothetical protein KY290_014580 [Solanum tuberosum]|uniref:Uncharacterized protein n=1 Tax=Solanum tuberosum TaxID=4113 RepID=A0ABQ7VQ55_SOLTU|nr:hypothetical protein KY289_014617 [Solanum tuberosum]KAH0699761.1 hypothetical protein KY284_013976 [Solanum tuberosum]KAH0770599.1 hypothetical protein KY290_014580 [Solanum tuberosum]
MNRCPAVSARLYPVCTLTIEARVWIDRSKLNHLLGARQFKFVNCGCLAIFRVILGLRDSKSHLEPGMSSHRWAPKAAYFREFFRH